MLYNKYTSLRYQGTVGIVTIYILITYDALIRRENREVGRQNIIMILIFIVPAAYVMIRICNNIELINGSHFGASRFYLPFLYT